MAGTRTTAGATVAAHDIARLADVGRAAVSNWRRRFPDFPKPVSGSATSPLYSLAEVEAWLTHHGKEFHLGPGDRVWQRIRGEIDELHMGDLLVFVGAVLVLHKRHPRQWTALARHSDDALRDTLIREVLAAVPELPAGDALPDRLDGRWVGIIRLAADAVGHHGHQELVDLLCDRYLEVHSRRLQMTPAPVAELMIDLAGVERGPVLDPACGIGTLLLAVPPQSKSVLWGQDVNSSAARLAAVRLLVHNRSIRVAAGDSLRQDAYHGERAEVVVCNPPFNERSWGYDELTSDPRWEYGLPPRGEPELAWVQHCLAHVNPGGRVVIMMPAGAASRRAGRRIRANLLRTGALRAVISLPTATATIAPDLWILQRPGAQRAMPAQVLMVDACADPSLAVRAWRSFGTHPDGALPDLSRSVRIIDLLDDDVDLSPTRHLPRTPHNAESAAGYQSTRTELVAAAAALAAAPPDMAGSAVDEPIAMTTVGELLRAGVIVVHQAPLRMTIDVGDRLVLTVKDVRVGRAPSGQSGTEPGAVIIEAGDVVTPTAPREPIARIVTQGGALLGPQLLLFRADPQRVDPHFLAGFLRIAQSRASRTSSLSARTDMHRAPIPRLPLADQRAYGQAFRQLGALEDQVRAISALGERLVRLGFSGLADGSLPPPPSSG